MEPVRVVVTGAAGQIGYSLLYMIGSGYVFGPDQPVILQLLDITPCMGVLGGVCMELDDCAFPLLKQVIPTDDPEVAFKDVDAAFMVGAMPRREGMERKDLLAANVKIFKAQGEALDKFAKKSVKVLVVGNPANTNALICSHYAPSIPKENFSAMTRFETLLSQFWFSYSQVLTSVTILLWNFKIQFLVQFLSISSSEFCSNLVDYCLFIAPSCQFLSIFGLILS